MLCSVLVDAAKVAETKAERSLVIDLIAIQAESQ